MLLTSVSSVWSFFGLCYLSASLVESFFAVSFLKNLYFIEAREAHGSSALLNHAVSVTHFSPSASSVLLKVAHRRRHYHHRAASAHRARPVKYKRAHRKEKIVDFARAKLTRSTKELHINFFS